MLRLPPSLPRTVSFALFLSLSIALLLAPTPPLRAADSLTLAQTLVLTTERHPALAAHASHERAATALIEQAAVRPQPTLEASLENLLGTGHLQGLRSLEATVQASQTFERGGKRDKRVTLATREHATTVSELAARRTDLLAITAAAYVHAVAAQQRLALAAEPVRLARETLALIDSRVRAGAASSLDLARARTALISAETDSTRAAAVLASARTALAATWGGTPADLPAAVPTGTLRTTDTLPAEAPLRARLAGHPRLALHTALIAARRASLDLAQAQSTADVTASAGVRFLRDGTDAGFVAGFSLPIPDRHRNQGNIRAARETLAGTEHSLRAVESELRANFTAAWQDLAAAHALAQQLRREALPAAAVSHDAVRRAYATGSIPFTDILDAERSLVALRREILAADTDYATALVRLEALTDPTFALTAAHLAP